MPYHDLHGHADDPLLVLGPSLGTSTVLWEPHLDALSSCFQVLRFDLPGHGGSPTGLLSDPTPGGTRVKDLAALVLGLVDHYGRHDFHYAGVSLGGAIGAHLAVHHPQRVASLAMVCSSAHFGPATPWLERASLVRLEGIRPVLGTIPGRWFADPLTAETPVGRTLLTALAETDPAGYAACCDALAAYDLRAELTRISAPTLVVGGSRDVATPLSHATELARGVHGATLLTIDAGHLAVEQPQALQEALLAHLGAVVR
ncbi:3-oxoadipate enol-lactone hydrolase [Streptomyces diastatochromogenes]|uniref:3-oxoadipate enol-lactone hydrolase n=1 Tax=Streptomyces diastatochromogenes TaxID=42236 RepID=A0A233SY81_STRDA|nr:3-oxoadipate enol-lactone hydrolase [Streptomyces diastatochromogenes]